MANRVFTVRGKIQKEKGKTPTSLENTVAQALYDIQSNPQAKDLGEALKPLYIVSASQVDVPGGRNAIVVFVPYTLRLQFRQIQTRLVRELEKKFAKTVVFIAQRRIIQKTGRNNKRKQQKRPFSRTLTAVHDAILDDLVYPTDVVGKRTRYKLDGGRQLKVYLDKNDQPAVENKTTAFQRVYRKLTGRECVFLFPDY